MPTPTIAELVRQHAQRSPDGVALRWPDRGYSRDDPSWRTITWDDLDQRSEAFARGLAPAVGPGDRVVVFVPPGPTHLALVLATWKLGATAVVALGRLEPRHALDTLRRAQPRAVVAGAWLHVLRPLFSQAFASVRLAVGVGLRWFWGGPRLADLEVPGERVASPADSGGPVLIEVDGRTPGRLMSHAQLLARRLALDEGPVCETSWSRVWMNLAAGRTSIWPKLDPRRPASLALEDWVAAVTNHELASVVTGPEVFGAVPEGSRSRVPWHAWVLGGPGASLEMAVSRREPRVPVTQIWSTRDAGPIARIEASEVRSETLEKTRAGRGYCVGRPRAHVEVRIVSVTDAPVLDLVASERPTGRLGEIVVRGPGVVVDYLDAAEYQDRATIEETWHRTGWVGVLDEDGRVWLHGAKRDLIETASGPVAPLPIEGVFHRDRDVRRCALVGVGPRGSAVPVLVVELEEGRTLDAARIERLRERDADTLVRGMVRRFVAHPEIPLDDAGDVDRAVLRPWAEARCADLVREAP